MWLPTTAKLLPMPVITPREVAPSPQEMIAEYVDAVPFGAPLINVATLSLNGAPAFGVRLRPTAEIEDPAGVTLSVP